MYFREIFSQTKSISKRVAKSHSLYFYLPIHLTNSPSPYSNTPQQNSQIRLFIYLTRGTSALNLSFLRGSSRVCRWGQAKAQGQPAVTRHRWRVRRRLSARLAPPRRRGERERGGVLGARGWMVKVGARRRIGGSNHGRRRGPTSMRFNGAAEDYGGVTQAQKGRNGVAPTRAAPSSTSS